MAPKNRPEPLYIRVLVSRRGDQWLAEGLERHLTAQAPSWRQALNSFIRVLRRRLQLDHQRGIEPLSMVERGPEHLFDDWDRLIRQRQSETDLVTHPIPIDDATPEAYVIHENAKNSTGIDLNT
jgi:hypothetical protein